MKINKETLPEFRKDFKEAVKALEEKYCITLQLGGITYSENQFTAKLTAVNGTDPDDVQRHAFDDNVWKFSHLGLEKGMYNRIFLGIDGKKYAIQGFMTNAKKYPLIIYSVSEKQLRRTTEVFVDKWLDEFYVDSEIISSSNT